MREQILGLITPMMALVFVVVFLVLWRRGRMGDYVLAFAGSYLAFSLGFTVTHVLDPGQWYVFHLSQLFYSLGCATVVWGAARRMGQRVSLMGLGIVYLLSAATLAIAVANSPDVEARLYIVNSGYAVMFVMGTLAMLQAQRRTAIDTLVILLFAVTAAQFLIRPVLTLLLVGGGEASQYRESIYYSVLSVAVTIQSLMTAVTLVGACLYDQIQRVRVSAEIDGLTGLQSRRAFEQDVVELLEKAKQEFLPVSLVVADIDHFKAVNDVWGHQVGDETIASFAQVVMGTIRDTDIAGRIGGEEFCVLAWNCGEQAATTMAERIRRKFAETQMEGMPEDHRLTASFGVAGRKDGEGYGKLFARADAALYRAKDLGRNRTVRDSRDERQDVVTPFNPGDDQKREILA